jgi:hypothetical protein
VTDLKLILSLTRTGRGDRRSVLRQSAGRPAPKRPPRPDQGEGKGKVSRRIRGFGRVRLVRRPPAAKGRRVVEPKSDKGDPRPRDARAGIPPPVAYQRACKYQVRETLRLLGPPESGLPLRQSFGWRGAGGHAAAWPVLPASGRYRVLCFALIGPAGAESRGRESDDRLAPQAIPTDAASNCPPPHFFPLFLCSTFHPFFSQSPCRVPHCRDFPAARLSPSSPRHHHRHRHRFSHRVPFVG